MLEALRHGIDRYQRRTFWEATIAVCAFVAAPKGKVSFAARVGIDNILDILPELKVFGTNEFVESFDQFVEEFRVNPGKARKRALEVARKGAKDTDEAELLARIALAIASSEANKGAIDLKPVEALCSELGVDPKTVLAAVAKAPHSGDRPQAAQRTSQSLSNLKNVHATAKEKTKMSEDQKPNQGSRIITMRSAGSRAEPKAASDPKPSAVSAVAAADSPGTREAGAGDLSQQLQVEGAKAVIALCGRTKTGALEALRIYENEQFAEADRALAEQIANEKFWLSPVTLFPSDAGGGDTAENGDVAPIHVLCLSRPDDSIEALRAFESADNANVDLDFFRNISNDKMWISVVQFKTVA